MAWGWNSTRACYVYNHYDKYTDCTPAQTLCIVLYMYVYTCAEECGRMVPLLSRVLWNVMVMPGRSGRLTCTCVLSVGHLSSTDGGL